MLLFFIRSFFWGVSDSDALDCRRNHHDRKTNSTERETTTLLHIFLFPRAYSVLPVFFKMDFVFTGLSLFYCLFLTLFEYLGGRFVFTVLSDFVRLTTYFLGLAILFLPRSVGFAIFSLLSPEFH